MSQNYPAATLVSARQTIRNGVAEALHLTTGDLPAAWGMARQYCLDMAEACRVTEIELADHFKRKAAQFTEVDFDDLVEAQAQKDAESRQMAEAEQISKAHPEVFSLSDFAAKSLGMGA